MTNEDNILDIVTECYIPFWKKYLLRFKSKGVTLDIDVDIEFPMLQQEWLPIQEGKKYRIIIQEV